MKVTVIGGGFGGRMAAARAVRSGHDVTLVDARSWFVERTRLHEAAARGRRVTWPHAAFAARIGARFIQGRIVGVEGGGVQLADGRTIDGDRAILAIGSRTVEGPDETYGLSGPEAAARIHAALSELEDGSPVAVVGAGLTGIELVGEIATAWPRLRPVLVGRPDGLSSRGQAWLTRRFADLGIRSVTARATGVGPSCVRTRGPSVDAELTVWTAGFAPAAGLADLGLPRTADGRIAVDEALRVQGRSDVLAIGDCAGTGLRMACATALPAACQAVRTIDADARGRPAAAFRFGYVASAVAVGRGGALVQWTDAQGHPRDQIWGGLPAVAMKQALLGLAAELPGWEHGLGCNLYGWSQPRGALA